MIDDYVKGQARVRSDWSKTSKCDYVTNRIVYLYYHPDSKSTKHYRKDKEDYKEIEFQSPVTINDKQVIMNFWVPMEIMNKIIKGDTIVIGFDYYSKTGVCENMIPPGIIFKDFSKNQVYIFDLFKKNNQLMIMEKINEFKNIKK